MTDTTVALKQTIKPPFRSQMLLSPVAASARWDWKQLVRAHDHTMQLHLDEATACYESVLPNIVDYIHNTGSEPSWDVLSADPGTPSLNWLCVYLWSYYCRRYNWSNWHYVAQRVFADPKFKTLPDTCQSQLISLNGWASLRKDAPLEIGRTQHEALARFQLGPLETGLHHMVLGYVYQMMADYPTALRHLEEAIVYFPPDQQPYWFVHTKTIIGSNYYHQRVYDTAIKIYQEIDNFVNAIGETAEFETRSYGFGWCYCGKQDYRQALANFQRMYVVSHKHHMYYDLARSQYAQANTHLLLGEHAAALTLINQALSSFQDHDNRLLNAYSFAGSISSISKPMTAACLLVRSSIHQHMGNLSAAITDIDRALYWQRAVDEPKQERDMLRQAVKLRTLAGYWRTALRCWVELALLRIRLSPHWVAARTQINRWLSLRPRILGRL